MKRPPRQVRLEEETEAEVKKIAAATNLPEIEVIRQTVRAGVAAIKENGYRLTLPLELKVTERGGRAASLAALAAEKPQGSKPSSSTKSPGEQLLEMVKKRYPKKPAPPT